MKNLNFRLLIMFLSLAIFIFSCSDNDEPVNIQEEEQEDYSEIARSAEIDKTSAIIDDISIKVYETQEANEDGKASVDFNLPDCVTVTVVAQQNFREITIDFGNEGCLVYDNILKGKIVLTYTRNTDALTILITKDFIDFYFNAKNLVGSKTLLKELSNENGNPQFTYTSNLTVIWPNGAEASREGLRIREWVEGFGNDVWSDNVFEVTGNWSTTFANGNTHTYEVVLPLRREVVCFFFVSGSIDVERSNFSGVFDYGDGDCDNMATFTFANGNVVDVVLN